MKYEDINPGGLEKLLTNMTAILESYKPICVFVLSTLGSIEYNNFSSKSSRPLELFKLPALSSKTVHEMFKVVTLCFK